eukprot:m.52756 g.52756  ORF g.52756 m.52756 type:complete len:52 (-) comp10815_c2_seq1:45-200(-)
MFLLRVLTGFLFLNSFYKSKENFFGCRWLLLLCLLTEIMKDVDSVCTLTLC